MICIIDDCCCSDCHQSKKEILECKRRFKKYYKNRANDNNVRIVAKTRVKIDENKNIISWEWL